MVNWYKWDVYNNNFDKYKEYKSILIYGTGNEENYEFSIMIPTYKRSKMLKQAIDSILKQNGNVKYSISVVDNCESIDEDTDILMKEYCSEYKFISYYRNEENIGLFGNWNRCIELAGTPWLCIICDDDLLKQHFLETVFPITCYTKCGLLGTYRDILDEREESEKENSIQHDRLTNIGIKLFGILNAGRLIPMNLKDVAYCRHFPCNPLVLNRKKCMEIGGFNDEYAPFADMVFTANMFEKYGAGILPERLTLCRFTRNESTKTGTLWASLETSELVKNVAKKLGYGERKLEWARQSAVVIEYNIFPAVKYKIDFKDVIMKYKLNKILSHKFIRTCIMVRYKLGWVGLLFRKREKKT